MFSVDYMDLGDIWMGKLGLVRLELLYKCIYFQKHNQTKTETIVPVS